jgi:GTP diphosphokinase / guanosine-3',5'-bis(diphosphate) 3'-diphosphatase
MVTVEEIINKVNEYNPNADVNLIRKAYAIASKFHQGQKRLGGEDFIEHPVEVAKILLDMHADVPTICAALLHDAIEDTKFSIEDVKREFDNEIASLVEGVSKIMKVRFKTGIEYGAENIRKVLFATTKDVRVILIKLADRLHNMQTLKYLREEKQKRIAKETMDIYAPIAHKLGMWTMKGMLEDLAFKYLETNEYKKIKEKINEKREKREEKNEKIINILKNKLAENHIEATVSGRAKYFYSIYRKMKQKNKSFDEIYDLIAVRVIVQSKAECYRTLNLIHQMWKPVPGRFKDYIANPKPNGYQSLHSDVQTPFGVVLEVQIRTMDMHYKAKYGVAAHWRYKGTERDKIFDRRIAWLEQILDWKRESKSKDFVESLKIDLFQDELVVFTPKGDPIILPEGSTPVDFAYEVHTDIGNHCSKAEVNGKIVPLSTKLSSGDIIHIVTQKNAKPSRNWLSFVETNRAKSKIRQKLGMVSEKDAKALRVAQESKDHKINLTKFLDYKGKKQLKISKCCSPQYGDPIAAFIMKDGSISIHKKDCINIATLKNNKQVPIKWKSRDRTIKNLEVYVKDRIGLIEDLLNLLAEEKVAVLSINIKSVKDHLMISLKMKVESTNKFNIVNEKIKRLDGVMDIKVKRKFLFFEK